jgi:hypothetical protein
LHVVGQKNHDVLFAVEFDQGDGAPQGLRIIEPGTVAFEHDQVVAQDALSLPRGGRFLAR